MPETEGLTTAAEIHAEILQEDDSPATIDNDEAKTDPDDETVEDSDETADEGDTEDEPEEEPEGDDEDDLPLSERLTLDDKVREADPEAGKRWDQQVKGLEKIEKRLKADESSFNAWMGVDMALSHSVEAARAQLQHLATVTARVLKTTPEELLGVATKQTEEKGEGKSKYGFEFDSEDAIYEKAKEDAKNELKTELGLDAALLKKLAEREAAAEQEKADKEWLDTKGKAVIARIEKKEGWKPDPALVLKAKREYPDIFKTDPFLALKKTDPDAYFASRSKTTKKTPPDVVESATSRGITLPDNPLDYSAAHALAEING